MNSRGLSKSGSYRRLSSAWRLHRMYSLHILRPRAVPFDPKKNETNLRRHGVSLTEGDGVLNDPLALTVEDTSAEGERRFVTIGMNLFGDTAGCCLHLSGPTGVHNLRA